VKLAKLLEWLAPKTTATKLIEFKLFSEMDGMGELEVAEPAEATTPDDAIDGAFKNAMHSIVDAYPATDSATVLGKLKELFKAHEKLSGKAKPEEKPAEPNAEKAAEEAKAKAASELKALVAEAVKVAVAEAVKTPVSGVKSAGREGAAKLDKKTEAKTEDKAPTVESIREWVK
jgi:hypothetical protein